MNNNKTYKPMIVNNTNMIPGDPKGLPDESLVFLDEGFIYKLSKYFGQGKPIKFDMSRIVFCVNSLL